MILKRWISTIAVAAIISIGNVNAGTLSADLGITKTDGVATATPGMSVTYTIVASNAGPNDASNATVTDTFPGTVNCSWTCSASAGSSCTAAGSGSINDLVNLLSGGSVTYAAVCNIDPAATGTLSNTATVAVSGSMSDPNLANNSATDNDTLAPVADLAITKTDNEVLHTPGTPVTYTIVAQNNGPSAVTDAIVNDTFVAPLSNCSWSSLAAGGASGNTNASGNLSDTLSLPPGSSVTYTVTCDTSANATGSLTNTATISSATATDPSAGNESATDADTALRPPIAVPADALWSIIMMLFGIAVLGGFVIARRAQS